jgi:hypothetical protein
MRVWALLTLITVPLAALPFRPIAGIGSSRRLLPTHGGGKSGALSADTSKMNLVRGANAGAYDSLA